MSFSFNTPSVSIYSRRETRLKLAAWHAYFALNGITAPRVDIGCAHVGRSQYVLNPPDQEWVRRVLLADVSPQ